MLVRRAYAFDRSDLFGRYVLVNVNYLKQIENELINKQEYLPVLIRRFLSVNYMDYIDNLGDTRLLNELQNTRRFRDEDAVKDLQDYINSHKEYSELWVNENYNKLMSELDDLKREYKDLDLW